MITKEEFLKRCAEHYQKRAAEDKLKMARDYTPKIAKKDLKHGVYYRGRCRNAQIARWNAEDETFYHWRTKFGSKYIEAIKHPEDEQHYDVFVVEAECEPEEVIEFKQ